MKSAIRKLAAIILIIAISCLPVASYAVPEEQAPDVEAGVIGGADGPTAVFVAEKIDMDPPLWYQWGYESMEDMLEAYEMTEDDYYMMVAMEMEYQAKYVKNREEELSKLGGTPGITNVMVNGEFARFTGDAPEVSDGVTYAPVRPVLTPLGAEFGYDDASRTVTVKYDDTVLSLVIGESEMGLTRGGASDTKDIKAAPYLKGGSAFIPVRAVFEALGCEVFWDADYSTVAVIDKAAVIAELDKDFSVLNKLLTMMPDTPSGAQKTTMDAVLDVTVFDTINGDKTVRATAGLTALYDEDSVSLSAQYDIAELVRLLYEDAFGYGGAAADDLPAYLKSTRIDAILNMAEAVMYLKTPIFEELVPELPAGAWIEIEDTDMFGDTLNEMRAAFDSYTVGSLIYDNASDYNYYNRIYLYDDIMDSALSLMALVGDANFKQSGNNYTLSINKDSVFGGAPTVSSVLGMLSGSYGAGSGLDLSVTIKTDGSVITEFAGSFKFDLSEYNSGVLISGSVDADAAGANMNLEVHVRNMSKVLLSMNSKTAAYSGEVPDAPPEGDTVIYGDEIYGGYEDAPAQTASDM